MLFYIEHGSDSREKTIKALSGYVFTVVNDYSDRLLDIIVKDDIIHKITGFDPEHDSVLYIPGNNVLKDIATLENIYTLIEKTELANLITIYELCHLLGAYNWDPE